MQLDLAAVAAHPEQIQVTFRRRDGLSHAVWTPARLNQGQDFVGTSKIAVCGNQQATQGVVGSAEIVEVDPRRQPALSLAQMVGRPAGRPAGPP